MRIGWLTGLALLALAGCARQAPAPPSAPPAPQAITGYLCAVVREGPQGKLSLRQDLNAKGVPDGAMVDWSWSQGALSIGMGWGQEIGDRPRDENRVWLLLDGVPGTAREVRLEIWTEGPRPAAPGVTGDWGRGDAHRFLAVAQLGALRAAGAQGRLVAAAVDRDGRILAQQSFDVAILGAPRAMIDAALPELNAMRADFRNRCDTYSDNIVVT